MQQQWFICNDSRNLKFMNILHIYKQIKYIYIDCIIASI